LVQAVLEPVHQTKVATTDKALQHLVLPQLVVVVVVVMAIPLGLDQHQDVQAPVVVVVLEQVVLVAMRLAEPVQQVKAQVVQDQLRQEQVVVAVVLWAMAELAQPQAVLAQVEQVV
jgi:hypothetical protein